jgi:hypothetical protein
MAAKRNLLMASLLVLSGLVLTPWNKSHAQGTTRWVDVGFLQNWYSEYGWEIEEGNVREQQYGLRWPAQYNYEDMQAAKSMWIGTTDFTDADGKTWTDKVVHVGPRVSGAGEFFPVTFDLYTKFERPKVLVDGDPSFQNPDDVTAILDTLKADRMIYNVVNTAIGVTVTRRILAFSQDYHSNYHIFEITYTNTGNTDADPEIEFPNKTLTGVYVYFQFRYSVCAEVRYEVNNSAGWGMNSMNDNRGFPPDIANPLVNPLENDIKCGFTWHGYHSGANKPQSGPNAASFSNIGAPIFDPSLSAGYVQASDTNWRLGGSQFVGHVHLYAPVSVADGSPSAVQPSTSNYYGSDQPLTQPAANNQFNEEAMKQEYALMTEGHFTPRHAWAVVPDGKFDEQQVMGNIVIGPKDARPGGFSSGLGYGPYDLAPGESFTIVFAEGADGLTREENIRIGKLYKDGTINTKAKNDSVLSGLSRLLDTFRRAKANYESGYAIPQPPYPPSSFTVQGGGDKISLSWTPSPLEGANGFVGYKLYRAMARVDSTYRLLFQAGGAAPTDPSVTFSPTKAYSFNDVTAIRGVNYYYYVTSFGDPTANTGVGNTPPGSLESSRFYTQAYNPSNLKRPAGTTPDEIRIVPNPYIISSDENRLRFPDVPDRIAFFNIPGYCKIRIFTELGELVYQIDHNDGTGDAYWNSITFANQVVVSGIYLVHVEVTQDQFSGTGEPQFKAGDTFLKKLVIVR